MNNWKLFCFGFGYGAAALARRLPAGWRIAATCREATKRAALAEGGIDARLLACAGPLADSATALAGAPHLLSSVPPGKAEDPVLARHGADIARLSGLRWVGYLSTTGVYGDRDGGWVDESEQLRPTGERGRRPGAAAGAGLHLLP